MTAHHIVRPRESFIEWAKSNRNLVLFVSVVMLIVMLPVFEHSDTGELLFTATTMAIIVIAAATNGDSRCCSGPPSRWRRRQCSDWCWRRSPRTRPTWCGPGSSPPPCTSRPSCACCADVFEARSITRDALFACANVYLLFGVLWCYLLRALGALNPSALPGLSGPGIGSRSALHVADLMYFSYNVVLQVALTNVVPSTKAGQVLVLLEELASSSTWRS
jgi:hypothetical protein